MSIKTNKYINSSGDTIYSTGLYCKVYGNYHREYGPAIDCSNGYKAWYLNGIKIDVKDNDQFLRIVKLKAFL
jgi:hypothetical protein